MHSCQHGSPCLTTCDRPIKHHLVLHRIDPEQGIRRFYSLMIERDLFGTVRLVRNWGRIGTNGQEMVEIYRRRDRRQGRRSRPSPGRSGGEGIGTYEVRPCPGKKKAPVTTGAWRSDP